MDAYRFVVEVENMYHEIGVLLMCSLRKIPVIGLDSGGTSEFIVDGVKGFKFKNYAEVEKAFNVPTTNQHLSLQIINQAFVNAEQKYSEKQYTENVYNFIINQNW